MEDPNNILILALISTIISVIAAMISLWKLKPEIKKLESDSSSSIGEAAESVATGARVTVDMLMSVKKELEENLKAERETAKAEIAALRNEVKIERDARILLQLELDVEKAARIKAENKMKIFQIWINALLEQLDSAGIPPTQPPFEWKQDIP